MSNDKIKNALLEAIKLEENYTETLNGATALKSTMNKVLDLFALGGSYRQRHEADCIALFKEAFEEDETLAMKCLFYLRDVRGGGQGERRFFRVCMRWLAITHPEAVIRNLENIAEYGRWDDLIEICWKTPCWNNAALLIKITLAQDVINFKQGDNVPVSLLAKWLPKEQDNSKQSRDIAVELADYLGISRANYRKLLSKLRERINIVETLLTEKRYDEIEFDKLPSKAGFKYSNLFARLPQTHDRYMEFINSKETKVHAGTLYPAEVIFKARTTVDHNWFRSKLSYNKEEAQILQKYWDNLTDYFNNATFDGIAIVDTSGSMTCGLGNVKPIDVAISLGMYCATKCHPDSPFYNHFISFSEHPQLVEIKGSNIVEQTWDIYRRNECANTNIEATINLLIDVINKYELKKDDIPKNLIFISDMQFDAMVDDVNSWNDKAVTRATLMEKLTKKFERKTGYKMPQIVYWNVNAIGGPIPQKLEDGISFVSGYSASTFDMIMSGKTGVEMMMEKLMSERYERVW